MLAVPTVHYVGAVLFCPFVGLLSAYYDSVAIIKSGAGMARQHPWFYCMIIEAITNIAVKFGGYETAFVAESMLQIIIAASISTHCLLWLRHKGINPYLLSLLFVIYAFCPIINLYMITLFKDVPISYLYMEWLILLYDCYESHGVKLTQKSTCVRIGILLLFSLLRNNGVYVSTFILFGLFVLCYKQRKSLIRFVIILFLVIIISNAYEKANNITHLVKETVGIPLQQIAAVVCDGGVITEKQSEFINQVLPLDFIREHYDPYTSDPLKWGGSPIDNKFLNTHKAEFLKVWIELCFANVRTYVDAYARATYGFWSTGDTGKGRYSTIYVEALDDFFVENDIHIKNVLPQALQERLEALTWESAGCFWGEGHLFWFFMFILILLILQRGISVAIVGLPCLGGWLTIMLSTPVAYSWRYIYYIPLSIPILIGILFLPSKAYKELSIITDAESNQEESLNDEKNSCYHSLL